MQQTLPTSSLIDQIKSYSTQNPWVAIAAAVILLLVVSNLLLRILKAGKHSAVTNNKASQIKKTLSNFLIGTADIIQGSTGTAVEITNTTNIPFTITQVILVKNKSELPLKLPYKGQLSPPRTLPKITELHNGPAQIKSQDTFVFSHPVNSIFILNDKETFHVVIDLVFNSEGQTEKLRYTSPTLKKKHIQSW